MVGEEPTGVCIMLSTTSYINALCLFSLSYPDAIMKDCYPCAFQRKSGDIVIPIVRPSGWVGEAKVSYILSHRCAQLILAYSWARPATLAAGRGRGGMFLFLLFLHFHSFSSIFLPCPSLSSPLLSLLSLFSLSLGDDTE